LKLVRPLARYGSGAVQHGTVVGGPQPLTGHVRRQHFGTGGGGGGGRPEVLRPRERVRPRVRRHHLRVAAGRVRAPVAVRVAHLAALLTRDASATGASLAAHRLRENEKMSKWGVFHVGK